MLLMVEVTSFTVAFVPIVTHHFLLLLLQAATLGSPEGAFENVRLNFAGDLCRTMNCSQTTPSGG